MPVRPRRAAAIREQIGALGNRERGQEQGEPHGEVLVAPHSPFEPANGLGARKARRLLGLGSTHPCVHRLFESNAVDGLQDTVKSEGGHCRASAEPGRPFRGTLLRVQCDVEHEEAGEHHGHAEELPEVNGRPDRVLGIGRKDHGMVVGVAVCVKKGDADIEELSDNRQRGRKAERGSWVEGCRRAPRSADDVEVHHHPRRVVLDVTVAHPGSGTVIGQPGDLTRPSGGTWTVSSQER